MSDLNSPLAALLARREFLKTAAVGALGLSGAGLLAKAAAAATATAPLPPGGPDAAILNFALNLEYLEGEYYSYAVTGASLEANIGALPGSGATGPVTVKANPLVPFKTPLLQNFAREITFDEQHHVAFVRQQIVSLGATPIARPPIDLLNSFNTMAVMAGVALPGGGFDPFADEVSFFIGAFILSDVGVTAYKGAAALLSNRGVINNAAGLLSVEAFHAANIRTSLIIADGSGTPSTSGIALPLNPAAAAPPAGVLMPTSPAAQTAATGISTPVAAGVQLVSNLRDSVDGANYDSRGVLVQDTDQGITGDTDANPAFPRTDKYGAIPVNFAPSDVNAVGLGRTIQQVLNVVYGNANGTPGGFFPSGANGYFR